MYDNNESLFFCERMNFEKLDGMINSDHRGFFFVEFKGVCGNFSLWYIRDFMGYNLFIKTSAAVAKYIFDFY